ncbi:hypothetical protein Tco_1262846 [Tanacetum coccineum]
MATNEETNAAGTDTRPPMLVESDYESWKIRIHRYIRGNPIQEKLDSELNDEVGLFTKDGKIVFDEGTTLRAIGNDSPCHDYFDAFSQACDMEHEDLLRLKSLLISMNTQIVNNLQHIGRRRAYAKMDISRNWSSLQVLLITGLCSYTTLPCSIITLNSSPQPTAQFVHQQHQLRDFLQSRTNVRCMMVTLLLNQIQEEKLSEEVLVHQVVSMKKMNEKPGHVRPANGFYDKLNALKFVPQQELSREQAYIGLPPNERASQN